MAIGDHIRSLSPMPDQVSMPPIWTARPCPGHAQHHAHVHGQEAREAVEQGCTRLNDLYSRRIRAGADGNGPNLAKALDVQREINRLVGLYRQTSLLPGQGTEGGGEASDELRAIGEPAAADFPLCGLPGVRIRNCSC